MPKLDPGTQRRQITRLLIVLAVVLFLGGGLAGLYLLNRETPEVLTEVQVLELARVAYAEEDYEQVVGHLENPASNHTTLAAINDDPEMLDIYINARRAIPLYDQRHLSRTVAPLTRLIELQPDQAEHGHLLLETLLTLDRDDDALKQGHALVKRHPGDTTLLRHLAQAQQRKGQSEQAFETLARVIEAEPLHVPTHERVLGLIEAYGLPTEPFVAKAQEISEEHPEDPRAMMIRSLAYQARGEAALAQDLLKQASAVPPVDQAMATLLTQWLDRAGMYGLASRYIMQHAEQGIDSPAGRLAVYRAFETGDHPAILARLRDSDPADANTDILGMWASAHLAAGDTAQADALLAELNGRDNAIASTWVTLIEIDRQGSAQPAQTIDAVAAVLGSADDPITQVMARRHPYLMHRLGLAYLDAREPEAALSAFSIGVQNTDSWSLPHRGLAEAFLKIGQPAAAAVHAREALTRDNSDMSRQWLVVALSASADPADQAAIDQVLAEADKLPAGSPEQWETLAVVADLLVRAGQTQQAKQRITAALQQTGQASEQAMTALMRVSALRDLGMEASIEQAIQARFGMTPGLALYQAERAAERDGVPAGRQLIEAATPSPATKPWQIVLAEYLAIQRAPSAPAMFLELAEQHPDDLALQLAALDSNAPHKQSERYTSAIDRLRSLAGDASIHWRLQQARVPMQAQDSPEDLQAAATLLDEARGFAPMHLELNLVLARCQLMLGESEAAADTAQNAKSIAPRSAQARLVHGIALHRLNRHDAARLDLIPLAQAPQLDPAIRQQACLMLFEQGETAAVQQAVEQMWSAGQASSPLMTLLARIYSRQGEYAKADAVCTELLRVPNAETIRFVSSYYHQTGRPELAEQAIASAKTAGLNEADKRMLLAEDAAQRGEADRALELIEQAAQADAQSPQRWHTAARLALSIARPTAAVRLAKLGLDHAPNDPGLAALVKHADLVAQIKTDPSLIPMAAAVLAQGRYHDQAVTALQTSARLGTSGEAAEALARLAQAHPEFKPLTELACDRLLRAGLDERAYALGKSAMARFTDSGVAARVTTLAAFRLEDWAMLLSAANAWAERVPDDRANADLMRAAAMNQLDRFGSTVKLLRPYIQTQDDIQASNELLFEYYTLALARTGDAAQAFAVLRPHLSTNPVARLIALRRVQQDLPQAEAVNAWLNELKTTSDSAQDRFLLATGAFIAGDRLDDEPLMRQADNAINALLAHEAAIGIDLHYAKGQVAQRLRDYPQAEASYRKVLTKAADNPQVMNNLALALVEQGGASLAEAEQLATRATQLAKNDANLYDTLAVVQLRMGKPDQALASINRAIELDEGNAAWRLTQADVYEAKGETDRAELLRERYTPRLQD